MMVFAAGCGQMMMLAREAYAATGGHAAVRTTLHDGLKLTRLLRSHGHRSHCHDQCHTPRHRDPCHPLSLVHDP